MSPRAMEHKFALPQQVVEIPDYTMEVPRSVELPAARTINVDPEIAAAKGLHIVASHNKLMVADDIPQIERPAA